MVHGTHNALDDPRNEEILVYINGELLPRQDAKISVFDSGYLVGDGVWEGQRLHHGTEVLFFKQMTHHLVELDWGFMREMVNIILTRDPRDMLPSYAQQVSAPSLRDVGYAQHIELLKYLRELGQEPPVLDARQTLLNPRGVLATLCARIGIPFADSMLQWRAGARPEDGVWASHWYENVHRSTGFQPYKPKTESFPSHLEPLLAECRFYYDQLLELAIH